MNTHSTYYSSRFSIVLYAILFAAAVFSSILAVRNIRIYPDSMVYSLMSQQILSGNGMRLPIIRLEDDLVPEKGTIPYPEEGPLLPILYALLGGVTPENYLPAQAVNMLSHLAIALFAFLLMKRIYDHPVVAVLAGILVSLSLPLLMNAHKMATESLFVALALAAVCFLVSSRHASGKQSIGNLLAAGLCGALAVAARFPGVALIPLLSWEVFLLVKNRSIKSKYVAAGVAAMLPIIMMGVLFLRNYLHSGNIFGWHPPSFERSYLSAIAGTLKMVLLQFRLGERPIMIAGVVWPAVLLYFILSRKARKAAAHYMLSGLDIVILFILSYGALITIAMVRSQSVYELRFVSPLVPFLIILCLAVLVVIREILWRRGYSWVSFAAMALSMGVLSFGIFYKTYSNAEMFFSKQEQQYFLLSSPTYAWIKEQYGEDIIITSNKPYHLSFFGGYSTIAIPHRRFDVNYRLDHLEAILPERMSRFGSRTLALFLEAEEKYDGPYIARLFNKREDYERFVLVKSFPDGVVYRLKE